MGSDREARLDEIRREAARIGAAAPAGSAPGYGGRSFLKPPVWTWEVPLYLFVGGAAGMAALIALGATMRLELFLARSALWVAFTGAVLSGVLLTLDLGRPTRFLNMLRVFKVGSPMSMGAWILTAFGAVSVPALLWIEWVHRAATLDQLHHGMGGLGVVVLLLLAVLGGLLATYTGVLLGATAVPAWFVHRRLLPVHFGAAGLGSAAAILLLLGSGPGYGEDALLLLAACSALAETFLWAWTEIRRHGAEDRALRRGRSGALVRASALLMGPAALLLWGVGAVSLGSGTFLLGAVIGRYGWIAAGRASAVDPEAAFALHGGKGSRP